MENTNKSKIMALPKSLNWQKWLKSIFFGIVIFSISGFNLLWFLPAQAAIPSYMSYQGRLLDSDSSALTGTYDFTFKIYDASSGGNLVWSETQTDITVTSGYFSVNLGSSTDLDIDFSIPYWITVEVNSDGEMSPRSRINSVGYSYTSGGIETRTEPSDVMDTGGRLYYDSDDGNLYLLDDVASEWVDLTAGGSSGADTDLNNLAATEINQALLPDGDNTQDIGSTASSWANLYIDGLATMANVSSTNMAMTDLYTTNINEDGSALTIGGVASGTQLTLSELWGNNNQLTIGNSFVSVDSNGYVGIGVSSPITYLDVVGNEARGGTHPSSLESAYFTGALDPNDGVRIVHSNGTQGIAFGYTGIRKLSNDSFTGSGDLTIDAMSTGNLLFQTQGTGSVGIATSTPDYLLDVYGGMVAISDSVISPDLADGAGDLYVTNDLEVDGVASIAGDVTFGSSALLYADTGNNWVGIATTTFYSGTNDVLSIYDSDYAAFRISDSSGSVGLSYDNDTFSISVDGTGGSDLQIEEDGDIVMALQGNVGMGSDAVASTYTTLYISGTYTDDDYVRGIDSLITRNVTLTGDAADIAVNGSLYLNTVNPNGNTYYGYGVVGTVTVGTDSTADTLWGVLGTITGNQSGTVTTARGVRGVVNNTSTGTITNIRAVEGAASNNGATTLAVGGWFQAQNATTIQDEANYAGVYALTDIDQDTASYTRQFWGLTDNAAAGYITNASGLYVDLANAGTIDTNYGIYLNDIVEGTQTDAYAMWANEGDIVIDDDGDGIAGGTGGGDLVLGEGQDAIIGYNGTNLIINSQKVGTGYTGFTGGVFPTTTATYDLGSTDLKWDDIWYRTAHAGDIMFANDFYLTEAPDEAPGMYFNNNLGQTVISFMGNGNVGIGVDDPQHPLEMASGAHVTQGGVWTDASDERLKANITDSSYGLNEVLQLHPRLYNYIQGGEPDVGFIAQEVREIIPELVTGDDNSHNLGLKYGHFAPILVKAIQEQQDQIEALALAPSKTVTRVIQSSTTPDFSNIDKLVVEGPVAFGRDSVGQARIQAGDVKVRIEFEHEYEYQPVVVLTLRGDNTENVFNLPNTLKYAVTEENNKGFTIEINQEINQDVDFNWHAFAANGGKLFVSNGLIEDIELVVVEDEEELPPVVVTDDSQDDSQEVLPPEEDNSNPEEILPETEEENNSGEGIETTEEETVITETEEEQPAQEEVNSNSDSEEEVSSEETETLPVENDNHETQENNDSSTEETTE